jgi:4-aminobutyrate aminotransferase-like enzyme
MEYSLVKKGLNTLGYPEAPKIVVTPPGPKSEKLFKKIQTVLPQQLYGLISPTSHLIWESAKGDTVRDVDGNVFIDFTAGFHMANAGHAPPQVIEAVREATSKIINTANWSHELRYEACKKLLSICPSKLSRVVLSGGSGTEATLAAVEAAKLFKKKNDVIALYTHYHGQSSVGKWWGRNVNLLMAPSCDCYQCPFKMEYPECSIYCAEFIEHVIRNGVLLIADEITCGLGRTGKWWACNWENVVPDILCTAKGLTSGFQGNAIVAPEEIVTALPPGSQIHSYAANTMTCAAIVSTIDLIIELDLVFNAHVVGELIRKRFLEIQSEHEMIGSVNCKGFNVGVTIVKDKASKEIDMEATTKVFTKWFKKGVLNYGFSWTTPPLCLTKGHMEKAIDLLEESICEVEKEK